MFFLFSPSSYYIDFIGSVSLDLLNHFPPNHIFNALGLENLSELFYLSRKKVSQQNA